VIQLLGTGQVQTGSRQLHIGSGLSIKDIRSQGEGVLGAEFRTFWCNNYGFLNLCCAHTDKGRLGVNFSRFCADVL